MFRPSTASWIASGHVCDGKKNAPVTPVRVQLGRRHLIELLDRTPAVTVIRCWAHLPRRLPQVLLQR
jgi:hypothetical protein